MTEALTEWGDAARWYPDIVPAGDTSDGRTHPECDAAEALRLVLADLPEPLS